MFCLLKFYVKGISTVENKCNEKYFYYYYHFIPFYFSFKNVEVKLIVSYSYLSVILHMNYESFI